MKDIVIVGHGGLAKEVAFLIEEINRARACWNLLGYITDQPARVGQRHAKYPIVGDDAWLLTRSAPLALSVAVGRPAVLREVHSRCRGNSNLLFPNLIHPGIPGDWEQIRMGAGNILLNGACFTTAIQLGDLNIFNPGCTVAHDCVLGSYNVVCPGANLSGSVVLEDETYIGTGAQVLQGQRVARSAIVGAGAVVHRNIVEAGTYAGVPAQRLSKK
jgi:sugar O-acyltransferase (sialic acid O-acetyltransferase NeuD family)